MKTTWLSGSLALLAAAFAVSSGQAGTTVRPTLAPYHAVVVAGSGELKPTTGRPLIRLAPDKPVAIAAGDLIECPKGAKLMVRLELSPFEIDGPSNWFPIPQVVSVSPSTASAFAQTFLRAGRERGGGITIYSPLPDQVLPATTFTVRFRPIVGRSTATVSLFGPGGDLLMTSDNIDGHSGVLKSRAMSALLTQCTIGGMRGPFRVMITDNRGAASGVRFQIEFACRNESVDQATRA